MRTKCPARGSNGGLERSPLTYQETHASGWPRHTKPDELLVEINHLGLGYSPYARLNDWYATDYPGVNPNSRRVERETRRGVRNWIENATESRASVRSSEDWLKGEQQHRESCSRMKESAREIEGT
ncbi:hypothetical protein CBL_03075 [Carabus blaptoides fortunei]